MSQWVAIANPKLSPYGRAALLELLRRGAAETLRASARHPMTILDHIRQAAQHGAVQFAARAADLRWRALVF